MCAGRDRERPTHQPLCVSLEAPPLPPLDKLAWPLEIVKTAFAGPDGRRLRPGRRYPDLFEVRPAGRGSLRRAKDILTRYIDQSFSYFDAVVFTAVDDDPSVDQVLTVDGRDFSIYRFAHSVEIIVP